MRTYTDNVLVGCTCQNTFYKDGRSQIYSKSITLTICFLPIGHPGAISSPGKHRTAVSMSTTHSCDALFVVFLSVPALISLSAAVALLWDLTVRKAFTMALLLVHCLSFLRPLLEGTKHCRPLTPNKRRCSHLRSLRSFACPFYLHQTYQLRGQNGQYQYHSLHLSVVIKLWLIGVDSVNCIV